MEVSDKNLFQYYTEEMNDGVLCDNTIISMFDGRLYHCGLADRLRGISSVYHFCKTQSRGFKLNFIHPFELTNYLIPNCYDWRINPDSIIYNLSLSKPITLFCDGTPNEIMRHRFFWKEHVPQINKFISILTPCVMMNIIMLIFMNYFQ